MINQTLLPVRLEYLETDDISQIWNAIKSLQVRGAPAIGIAAAMGVAAAVQHVETDNTSVLLAKVDQACAYLSSSRPTAVNLFWALDRMKKTALKHANLDPTSLKQCLALEAMAIRNEDADMCRKIGIHGAMILKDGDTVLTHCNAGSLATAEYGSALAPVYTATKQGKKISVFANETRPLLQGARLTAWELQKAGINVTLICDNTAGQVMKEGKISCVMVGADRIAANGDVANKIGTYSVAVLAHKHKIPFYVLAPSSTIDFKCRKGLQIPIEERDPSEVTCGFGRRTAPEGINVYSPAFDVTPARLITAVITENGSSQPVSTRTLKRINGVQT